MSDFRRRIGMFRLPKCDMPFKQYHERQDYNIECGKNFKTSLNFHSIDCCSVIATNFNCGVIESYDRTELIRVPYAGNPEWATRQFGAVNTVENSACIAFVAKMVLDYFGFNYSMEDILSALESNGYRKWKLSRNKKTLSTPQLNAESIKAEFPEDDPIQSCETLEEIFHLYGEPVGIGGAAVAIDNVINYIAHKPYHSLSTRISSIDKVLENLKNGILVPVRVNNAIYNDDDSRVGGHYVVLFALLNGYAFVLDSSEPTGINILYAKQFFNAVTANENLIAVWDLSCCLVDE